MNTYTLISAVYDYLMDDVLYALYLSLIDKHTNPSMKSLEAGCGTAHLSRELSRKGYHADAFDRSLEMLEVAAYLNGEEGLKVNFFEHDLNEPLDGAYDLVLMPVDVINHAEDAPSAKRMFEHATNVLNKGGIFIYDYLKCEYISQLIGHEETIDNYEKPISWRVEASPLPCAHIHKVTMEDLTASHTTRSYEPTWFETLHKGFEHLETIALEERNIIVLKKR